jgi:hypothetical protein
MNDLCITRSELPAIPSADYVFSVILSRMNISPGTECLLSFVLRTYECNRNTLIYKMTGNEEAGNTRPNNSHFIVRAIDH